jgi:glyoxylase-like metal-dependent hydrolase (beta-lactamase superfamily II)
VNADSDPAVAVTTAQVRYPVEGEPGIGDGSAKEVAPGVLWLRMPLRGPLRWINVWALGDHEGWTIVDTGIQSPETIDAWQQAFGRVLLGRPVKRVLATHMHPDHCGVAGWLTERFGVRLWMSRLEYLTCRLMAADTGRQAPPEGIGFYRAAGWDVAAIERYQAKFGRFGETIYPLPGAYRRICDAEVLQIGSHNWAVVVGSGHSPEHACLYCAELKLLISGDQVLPKISSNVSVYPVEPDADPLADWLTSLTALKLRVPDDVLVLPAHNTPFLGLHARVDQLHAHHHRGLVRLQERLVTRRRVVDVFETLFSRPIADETLGMATGEAVAHLNYLRSLDRAIRETDEEGIWRWSLGVKTI